MSYDKQTWVNGEVITAEKLNHIEDGIENSSGYKYIVERDDKGLILYDSGTTISIPGEGLAAYQQNIEEPYMEWLESAALTGVCFSRIYNSGDKVPFFEGEASIFKIDSDYIIGELDPDTSKPDFSKCPFYYMIYVEDDNLPIGTLITKDAGDYEIDFSEIKTTVITTPPFRQAVNETIGESAGIKYITINYSYDEGYFIKDYSFEDFISFLNNINRETKLKFDDEVYTLQSIPLYNGQEYFNFWHIGETNNSYYLKRFKINKTNGIIEHDYIQLQTVENMEG